MKGFARARSILEISLESALKAPDVSAITAGVIFPLFEISFSVSTNPGVFMDMFIANLCIRGEQADQVSWFPDSSLSV